MIYISSVGTYNYRSEQYNSHPLQPYQTNIKRRESKKVQTHKEAGPVINKERALEKEDDEGA